MTNGQVERTHQARAGGACLRAVSRRRPEGREHGEVTAIQGKPMPPTPKPNQGFLLVDPTKNGSGKTK